MTNTNNAFSSIALFTRDVRLYLHAVHFGIVRAKQTLVLCVLHTTTTYHNTVDLDLDHSNDPIKMDDIVLALEDISAAFFTKKLVIHIRS